MTRLQELLAREKATKERVARQQRIAHAESSIARCGRCGAWTIAERACATPFCFAPAQQVAS